MVPLSDWTCLNFGVFANAQTGAQSNLYIAPMSVALARKLPLSGFTNPESAKTTPSCQKFVKRKFHTVEID
jgi:hypothetical protein